VAEWILGVGHLKSIRDICVVGEHEIIEKEGPPRKLTLRSASVEVTAERPEYSGPWTTFSVRAHAKGHALQCMEKIADEYQPDCELTTEDGWQILRFPGPNAKSPERALDALDAYSAMQQFPEVWRVRGEKFRVDHVSVELLFKALVEYKASDVHLSPGEKAMFRVDGEIAPSDVFGVLSAPQILALIQEVAPEKDWAEFVEHKQASFNFHQAGLGYSRVSCFVTAGAPHVTFRYLPERIPSFEDLHLPVDLMETLAELHHGLVLLAGMTGSGKSTTVAALVDYINAHHTSHILTIENPVEYVYHNRKALMSQRNLGTDVATFGLAVTGALRHDPDIIVIGEMRDPDTIRAAINAAATGHLVISTLHSNTAFEVVNRIVSFFSPVERDLVKLQIRDCLRCVICQRLLPKVGGGRIPAIEVLFNDIKAINDSIMTGDTDGIRIGMQQTTSHSWIFENYLFRLQKEGKITLEQARRYCTDVSMLDQMIMGTYSVPRLESIKHTGAQK